MLTQTFLETIVTDSNAVAKIYNAELMSPLAFNPSKEVIELSSQQLVNLPIMKDDDLAESHLDLLLIELILTSNRCTTFDILNKNVLNLRAFIRKAVRDFKKDFGTKVRKVAVLGGQVERFYQPFMRLLRSFEYAEFIECEFFENSVVLLPLDIKIGALVRSGKGQSKYGMLIYEEYLKKLTLHSDDDVQSEMAQLVADLDAGDL